MRMFGRWAAIGALILAWAGPATAATLHVAVAANFHATMTALAAKFEAASGDRVLISAGSTGKLYAQIVNGAPYDLFFAADVRRPGLLQDQGRVVDGSRFIYAIGRLALWSAQDGYVDSDGDVLKQGAFDHLAIAAPEAAPYGAAAVEVLKALDLYSRLQDRLVRGQNIAQTFHFVASGNAELGFVALSEIRNPARPAGGSAWIVPQRLYSPLKQQAVIIKGHDSVAAHALMHFVKSQAAAVIIERFGYSVPATP